MKQQDYKEKSVPDLDWVLKVLHEGTGRRDLLQGLVPCRVYTVEPFCGDKSLEVFT